MGGAVGGGLLFFLGVATLLDPNPPCLVVLGVGGCQPHRFLLCRTSSELLSAAVNAENWSDLQLPSVLPAPLAGVGFFWGDQSWSDSCIARPFIRSEYISEGPWLFLQHASWTNLKLPIRWTCHMSVFQLKTSQAWKHPASDCLIVEEPTMILSCDLFPGPDRSETGWAVRSRVRKAQMKAFVFRFHLLSPDIDTPCKTSSNDFSMHGFQLWVTAEKVEGTVQGWPRVPIKPSVFERNVPHWTCVGFL